MSADEIVSVYAVFGNDEEARRIARHAVELGLAACVNILGPCHSIYRWQGKVEEADEVAALFKTSATRARELVDTIGRLHSYEVPAAVVWTIAEAPEVYRQWVVENSKR